MGTINVVPVMAGPTLTVVAGLVPANHPPGVEAQMAGTSPAMTIGDVVASVGVFAFATHPLPSPAAPSGKETIQ